MLTKVETENDTGAAESAVPIPEKGDSKPFLQSNLWFVIRAVLQAVLMVAIIFAAYKGAQRMIASKPPTKSRPAFKTVYTIETVKAVKTDNQPMIVSYGQTIAGRTVDLRSLVSGEVVAVSPNLRTGARVQKGEPLVSIDSFNYEGALQEARANLAEADARMEENKARISLEKSRFESAREQLQFAQADFERANKLRARGTSTQQQLEARKLVVSQRQQSLTLSRDTIKVEEARLNQMLATIDRLKWKVLQAQRNLDSTKLIAPFTGIIRSSAAETGRLVSANDVVVSMYEEGLLEAKFTLSDAQFGRLQSLNSTLIGRPVRADWTIGGKTLSWNGKIDRLGAEISSSRGGVEVFALLAPSGNRVQLRPGAFVEVTLADRTFKETVVVPDTAIYGNDTVYVAADGKLVEKKVVIAAYDGETAIIESGVDEGDEILTTRITEVGAGLAVRKEGEAIPQRGSKAGQKSPADTGRPSKEEMTKILKSAGLKFPEFRALSSEKKSDIIANWRAKNAPAKTN